MSEVFPTENDKSYWKIVHDDDFYGTILVPIVADDGILKRDLAYLLLEHDNELEEKIVQGYYDRLERYFDRRFGLPKDLCDRVFDICETNLREEEFQHGES